tara:strand:- start:4616 stop:5245 length:630 start_codon:yes stop_codon:yes gene_type:complete
MYLKKCLSSVLKNDLTRVIEIIIIDDSSTDKSLKLIEKLKKSNKKIRSLKVKYKNLSKTLNYAIRTVKTEWLLKIDADDYISQNMIKEFVRHWINCDFILGNVCLFNKNKINKKKQVIKTNFLKFFFHPIGSGNLYKKKLWQTIGGYNESNKFKDDVYFWIKILKIENLKIKHLNNYMYFYRQHKKSMSKNTLKKNLVLLKIIFNDLLS